MAVNDSLFNMDVVIFRWVELVKSEPKSVSRDAFATLKISQKCICGRGSARTPLGSSQRSFRPLAGFGGRFAAERRRGRKQRGREGKGREGRKHKRRGEDGEGKDGSGGKEKGWQGRGLGH